MVKSERGRRLRDFDFAYAAQIFERPIVSRIDRRQEYGEVRVVATGRVASNVLVVVYTERGHRRRIISARKASRRERKSFETRWVRMKWPITGGSIDQAKFDATTEEEIEQQAIEDGTDQIDWSEAVVMPPLPKEPISIRVDLDVLDWFRRQGKGYQTRINAVLRRHMQSQLRRAGRAKAG